MSIYKYILLPVRSIVSYAKPNTTLSEVVGFHRITIYYNITGQLLHMYTKSLILFSLTLKKVMETFLKIKYNTYLLLSINQSFYVNIYILPIPFSLLNILSFNQSISCVYLYIYIFHQSHFHT
jgi:hypothetical protein